MDVRYAGAEGDRRHAGADALDRPPRPRPRASRGRVRRLNTTARGALARWATSRLAPMAARSGVDGRQGTSTKSASVAAARAPVDAWGAVSTTTRPAPAFRQTSTARDSRGGCTASTRGRSTERKAVSGAS